MNLSDDRAILLEAKRWRDSGEAFALALVIATWGSSPREAGSLMAIRGDGSVLGSVSGGCVEGEVITSALNLIKSGGAERFDFGVADETAWSVGLSCGGEISVWVIADALIEARLLEQIGEAIGNNSRIVIGCDLEQKTLTIENTDFEPNSLSLDGRYFYLDVAAPPRLYIIGGGHISQYLAPMAKLCGFAPIVIEPRENFANKERFSDIEVLPSWPQDALKDAALNEDCALVALTHDPKIDDEALAISLEYPLFYIAALGSSRSHAKRQERLTERGLSAEKIARIHGPAGLAIGAVTPAEIAASILAEMIAARRKQ